MSFGALLVTGADGSQREIALDAATALVGRSAANTIVLDELSVARRHARLSVESGRLLVEDLASAEGTYINGERLQPRNPALVEPGDELRFGNVVAYFTDVATPEPESETEQGAAAVVMPGQSSTLRISLQAPSAPIVPGSDPVPITMALTNIGQVVDEIRIEVRGVPDSWIVMSQASVVALPGDTRQAGFALRVPRTFEAAAGSHELSVVATSVQTGREALATATIRLEDFEDTEIELVPRRSKKNFKVMLTNRSNVHLAYALSGTDEEEVFKYQFEEPDITLAPGEAKEVNLRIKRPRKWAGHTQAAPFKIIAEPQETGATAPATEGQLQIRPIFGKVNFSPATIMLLLVVVGLGAYFFWPRDNLGPTNAEAAFDGVHLCDQPADQRDNATATPEATAVPGPGEPGFTGSTVGAPFFAQNNPQWANVEYAKAADPTFGPDWCGTTIAQCGCAMTSVATVMAMYALLEMPDGTELSPEALNAWFNKNATLTERGWVSQGYIYGDVIWTAANQLSAEMHAQNPNVPTIRFARTGTGSEEEIRSELEAGRPIILAVPGHWIAAVGLDADGSILINDPYYRDRTHLDKAYPGKVLSSVLFEPSDDLSAVVFTAPSDVRMRITDKQGRVVGTLNTGTAEEAEAAAVVGIPGASYSSRKAWRDPTCIADAPPTDAGTNQIILPGGAEDYTVEIIDAEGKPASIAVHTYGQDGTPSIDTIETDKPSVADVAIAADGSGAAVTVQKGVKPTPEPEVTAQNQEEGTPEATGTPSATASPSVPTPTPTPPPLETSLSLPIEAGQDRLEIGSTQGFSVGDTIVVDPGTAIEESNNVSGLGVGTIIVASPVRFSHSAGAVIVRIRQAPPNPDGSPPGNGGGEVPEPLVPPDNVTVGCSTLYNSNPKRATVICGATIEGTFTSIKWTSNGTVISEAANKKSLFLAFEEDTSATIVLSACNITICRSTSAVEAIRFPVVNTLSTDSGSTTPGQPVPPPPPTTGITISCATTFNAIEQSAQISCVAAYPDGTPYTSITWSAPGAEPANQTSLSTTFTTFTNDPEAVIRVTATICNYSVCSTSDPFELNFGETIVEIAVFGTTGPSPNGEFPQYAPITITATVRGSSPPTSGFVNFGLGPTDEFPTIGATQPLIPAGDFGFATVTIEPNPDNAPLNGEVGTGYDLYARYSGGATLFPGVSDPVHITIVEGTPDDCDSINNDGDNATDEDCDYTVDVGQPRSVGGGTQLHQLTISDGVFTTDDIRVAPGTLLTVSANVTRTDYCPGCIRQVYIGIAANQANGVGGQGPTCVISAVLPAAPNYYTVSTQFVAPQTPGVYYVRVTGSLQYSCIQQDIGPPSTTAGRIVVQGVTNTTVTANPATVSLGETNFVTIRTDVGPTAPAVGAPTGTLTFTGIQSHPAPPNPTAPVCWRAGQPHTGTNAVNPSVPVQLTGGTFSLECDVSKLTSGNYIVRANYTPDPNVGIGLPFYSCSGPPNTCQSAAVPVLAVENPVPVITGGTGLQPSSVALGADRDITILGSGYVNGQTQAYISTTGGCPANGTALTINTSDPDQSPTRIDATIPAAALTAPTTNAWIIVDNPAPGGGCDDEPFTITASGTTITGFSSDGPKQLGQTVTFTGTVNKSSSGGGSLSGTVRICLGGTDSACTGGTELGTDTINGSGAFSVAVTATPTSLPAGTNTSIRAYYLGSTNFGPSQSGTISVTINAAPTSTAFSISAGPHNLGSSVTLTADVTSTGGGGADITGTVTFRLGGSSCATGTQIGSPVTLDGSDQAQLMTTAIPAGSNQTVRACYSGNSDYGTSNNTATITVNQATPTISLSANPTTVDAGEDVVLTATISQTGSFVPTGSVVFKYGGGNCTSATTLGTDTTGSVSNQWTWTTHILPGGSQTIRACYAGDSNYASNNGTTSVTVNATGAGISVASNPASPVYGASTTLTATLVESLPSADPTGTVTLCWGGTLPDCSDVPGSQKTTGTISSHVASGTLNITQLGTVVIRAYWPGDSNFTAVSDSDAVTVVAAPTTATLTSPADSSSHPWGSNITFAATVSPPSAPGTVSFYFGPSGSPTLITSAAVSSGTATSTVVPPASMPASGTAYTIFARFVPSSTNYLASPDSTTRSITITPATTNVATTASSPVLVGATVNLGATVTFSTGGGTIAGVVRYWLGANSSCTGGTQIGGDVAVSGGSAPATTTFSTAGTKTISAQFVSSSTNVAGSCDATAVTVTVNNPTPTITNVSPNTARLGAGNTAITIAGTNFISGVTTVTFDADGAGGAAPVSITFTVDNATQISATIPSGQLTAAGSALVIVTNADAGRRHGLDYIYDHVNISPATLFALTPSGGPAYPLLTRRRGHWLM